MNVFTIATVLETALPLLLKEEPVIAKDIQDMMNMIAKDGPAIEEDAEAILGIINKIRASMASAATS